MTRRLAAFLATLIAGASMALASGAGEKLTGEEIRQAFSGNTIAGTYSHGGIFSEFHAADGRALGDNGFQINVDACWNVDGDAVCYHYGARQDRKTYCFTVERFGDEYRLSVRDSGRMNALAKVIRGNPSEHGDGGRRWSCDDLLAGLSRPLRQARR